MLLLRDGRREWRSARLPSFGGTNCFGYCLYKIWLFPPMLISSDLFVSFCGGSPLSHACTQNQTILLISPHVMMRPSRQLGKIFYSKMNIHRTHLSRNACCCSNIYEYDLYFILVDFFFHIWRVRTESSEYRNILSQKEMSNNLVSDLHIFAALISQKWRFIHVDLCGK